MKFVQTGTFYGAGLHYAVANGVIDGVDVIDDMLVFFVQQIDLVDDNDGCSMSGWCKKRKKKDLASDKSSGLNDHDSWHVSTDIKPHIVKLHPNADVDSADARVKKIVAE